MTHTRMDGRRNPVQCHEKNLEGKILLAPNMDHDIGVTHDGRHSIAQQIRNDMFKVKGNFRSKRYQLWTEWRQIVIIRNLFCK
jgi:hypothetical protein